MKAQKCPNEGPICSRFRGENEQIAAKFEPETDASQILSREAYPREELLRLQGDYLDINNDRRDDYE